jgi:hypothetical protein
MAVRFVPDDASIVMWNARGKPQRSHGETLAMTTGSPRIFEKANARLASCVVFRSSTARLIGTVKVKVSSRKKRDEGQRGDAPVGVFLVARRRGKCKVFQWVAEDAGRGTDGFRER